MSRGRQVLRQWMVLRALENARRGLSVDELRELVEDDCSPRTLYRDLENLQIAGFPLHAREGRWRLLRDAEGAWVVPVQPTEVLSLMLTEDLLEPARGTYLAEPLHQLRQRLMAMMTPAGRAYCTELRSSAVATLFAPGDYAAHRAELEAIEEAIGRQHRLRIVHVAPNQESKTRDVEPYSTWFHAGRLYLIAFCLSAGDIRTFAVQRIQSAEVLDEPFDADPAFDPAAFARQGFGVFHGALHHMVIDFSPRVAHLIREFEYHQSQQITERPGGWVRLALHCAGLPEVASWVAGFGGDARPIAPSELVEAVIDKHRSGLAASLGEALSRGDNGWE